MKLVEHNNKVVLKNGNAVIITFYYDFDTKQPLQKAYDTLKRYDVNELIRQAYMNRKRLTCYNFGVIA